MGGEVLLAVVDEVRSAQAALFFASKGLTNVSTMRGGIDVWAVEVDPTLPRY